MTKVRFSQFFSLPQYIWAQNLWNKYYLNAKKLENFNNDADTVSFSGALIIYRILLFLNIVVIDSGLLWREFHRYYREKFIATDRRGPGQ